MSHIIPSYNHSNPSTFNSMIHCQSCTNSRLCIPASLTDFDVTKLDNIIGRKKPIQKSQLLFQDGEPLTALYAVRSGTLKSYTVDKKGKKQICAFHLPGDIIGFGGIYNLHCACYTQSLETSMLCELPFDKLDDLMSKSPRLRYKIMRLMGKEIQNNQHTILLLSKATAEVRLAAFIKYLSNRYFMRGFSAQEFYLTMTRSDIGNYLGLTVETISRLLGRFQKMGLLKVAGKNITITNMQALEALSELDECGQM